jgi:UDP-N-acetylglucosamine transferase subunit ALG13
MKLFVTVGYQMSFDRLVIAVDEWAANRQKTDVFAQIGPTGTAPTHVDWVRFLEPNDFQRRIEECDAVVAHAGMGSILMALQYGKPILVIPRKGALKETRNDHQIATANRFAIGGHILVAMDEAQLPDKLDELCHCREMHRISNEASPELISAIREFIHGA